MAYHFRRLRQTLRLIPSTKTIGFTTRAHEGDQSKNALSDGNFQVATQCQRERDGLPEPESENVISRSHSELDLLSRLCPSVPASLAPCPMTYNDLVQILLPLPAAEHTEGSEACSKDVSSFLSSVKLASFNCDDIHETTTVLSSCRYSSGSPQDFNSKCELVPVGILSYPHCKLTRPTSCHDISSCAELMPVNNLCTQTSKTRRNLVDHCLTQVYCSSNGGEELYSSSNHESKDGPSSEQLHKARDQVENLVLHLFKGRHDYKALHNNVVFENNLFGENKVTVGLSGYKMELLKLRLRIYLQFFNTSMEILSVTTLEQTGIIRIHWRLKGLPQVENLKFWRLFQNKSVSRNDWEWVEAFSYFHIGKDGLVHKHRIDRMISNNETESEKLTEKLRGLLSPAKPLVS